MTAITRISTGIKADYKNKEKGRFFLAEKSRAYLFKPHYIWMFQ